MSLDSVLAVRGNDAFVPLQSLSPARKLAAAAVFAVCVSLLSGLAPALAACLVPLFLAVTGGVSLAHLGRRLLPVNFFFLFLWLALPLDLSSGSPALSASGLRLAALITVKGNAVAATILVLAGTSPIGETCRGLLRLRLPEKLVTLLLLTLTNLADMQSQYVRLSAAARLRGFRPSCSPFGLRTTAYLAAMLLIRSWQRAGRVSQAMRLRGFVGRFPLLDTGRSLTVDRRRGQALLGGICAACLLLLFSDLYL